jgi:hypothetical protein
MVSCRLQGTQLSIPLLNDFSLRASLGAAVAPGAAAPALASSSMDALGQKHDVDEKHTKQELEHSPEQKAEPCATGTKANRSGWIEQYKVKRRESEYLYFRYCYRDGFRGKTHHHHLKSMKIAAVRALIASGGSVDEVLSLL